MKLGGWKSERMVMRYAHVNVGELQHTINKLPGGKSRGLQEEEVEKAMKYRANLNGSNAIGNGEVDSSILSGSTIPLAGDPHNALSWNLIPQVAAPGYALASTQAAFCRLPQSCPLHARDSHATDGWQTRWPRPPSPPCRMQTYCLSISTKSGARREQGFQSVGASMPPLGTNASRIACTADKACDPLHTTRGMGTH
jgi:hypothetical protein